MRAHAISETLAVGARGGDSPRWDSASPLAPGQTNGGGTVAIGQAALGQGAFYQGQPTGMTGARGRGAW